MGFSLADAPSSEAAVESGTSSSSTDGSKTFGALPSSIAASAVSSLACAEPSSSCNGVSGGIASLSPPSFAPSGPPPPAFPSPVLQFLTPFNPALHPSLTLVAYPSPFPITPCHVLLSASPNTSASARSAVQRLGEPPRVGLGGAFSATRGGKAEDEGEDGAVRAMPLREDVRRWCAPEAGEDGWKERGRRGSDAPPATPPGKCWLEGDDRPDECPDEGGDEMVMLRRAAKSKGDDELLALRGMRGVGMALRVCFCRAEDRRERVKLSRATRSPSLLLPRSGARRVAQRDLPRVRSWLAV